MTVGKICRREVHMADVEENAGEVARRMRKHNLGTVIVVDGERRPAGIVTDRDLALRVVAEDRVPAATRVREVMSQSPRVVAENTPIEEALGIMRSRRHRRLPVVGSDGRIVGIVTLDDILDRLAGEMQEIGRLVHSQVPVG